MARPEWSWPLIGLAAVAKLLYLAALVELLIHSQYNCHVAIILHLVRNFLQCGMQPCCWKCSLPLTLFHHLYERVRFGRCLSKRHYVPNLS